MGLCGAKPPPPEDPIARALRLKREKAARMKMRTLPLYHIAPVGGAAWGGGGGPTAREIAGHLKHMSDVPDRPGQWKPKSLLSGPTETVGRSGGLGPGGFVRPQVSAPPPAGCEAPSKLGTSPHVLVQRWGGELFEFDPATKTTARCPGAKFSVGLQSSWRFQAHPFSVGTCKCFRAASM